MAGGVDEHLLAQNEMNRGGHAGRPLAAQHKPGSTGTCCRPPPDRWPALQHPPAEDQCGAASQRATACAAQEAGKFKDEIAPITVMMGVADGGKATPRAFEAEVTVTRRSEGLRAGTTCAAVSGHRPALPGGVISAGNASQFSDGRRCLHRDERRSPANIAPEGLGRFLGFAVAGCEPDEMGIGPVFARAQRCSGAPEMG